MDDLSITERDGAVRFAVRVKPRSSRSKILGVRASLLEIAVTAPPVEGAANDEVCTLLGRALEVPRSAVTIVTGASGRSKLVEVSGIVAATAAKRLAEATKK